MPTAANKITIRIAKAALLSVIPNSLKLSEVTFAHCATAEELDGGV
jgi:hypothetical protein